MEQVIHDAGPEATVYYLNNIDFGLLTHYYGSLPDELSVSVRTTDDLPEGEVALDNTTMPDAYRAAVTDYLQSAIESARTRHAVDVAIAQSEIDEDDIAMAVVRKDGSVKLLTEADLD